VSSALQHWARQVTGCVWGQMASGTGLLRVPVQAQAQETAQALQRFLEAAVQALGGSVGMGDWDFRVIGPLTPGSARQVGRQLARRGWPVS
jgi:hypothetical protein